MCARGVLSPPKQKSSKSIGGSTKNCSHLTKDINVVLFWASVAIAFTLIEGSEVESDFKHEPRKVLSFGMSEANYGYGIMVQSWCHENVIR